MNPIDEEDFRQQSRSFFRANLATLKTPERPNFHIHTSESRVGQVSLKQEPRIVEEQQFEQPPLYAGSMSFSAITPNAIQRDGGTGVVITGSGFPADVQVIFVDQDGTEFEKTVNSVSSDGTTIDISPGSGTAGIYDVKIVNPDTSTNIVASDAFNYYSINSVSPNNGPATGGTAVTITGAGLPPDILIKFGGITARVNWQDDTTIFSVAPAHAAGLVDLLTYTEDSLGHTLIGGYTYNAATPPPAFAFFNSYPREMNSGGTYIVDILARNSDGSLCSTYNGTVTITWVNRYNADTITIAPLVGGTITFLGGSGMITIIPLYQDDFTGATHFFDIFVTDTANGINNFPIEIQSFALFPPP